MLSVKNLIKTYQTKGSSEVKALDGVSIDFPETGMVFILGKSGSGKSTLLNILGGIDEPSGGELILDGRSCKTFSEKELNAYRNESVGFVFQDYNLIDTYTVAQNIAIALELQGRKAQKSEIEELLKKLNLQDDSDITFYDRKVNELSGGQKQRVAIARALVKGSQIILADEPTGALDYHTGQELYGILKQLSQDRLVIVVTHDEESAKKYGDRIIELKDGKIIRDEIKQSLSIASDSLPKSTKSKENKGKLHLGRAFIMGASAVAVKPFRLFVVLLIATISFVTFGFAFTALMSDSLTCELRTMYDSGYSVMRVERSEAFTESELNLIRENIGSEPCQVIYGYNYDSNTVLNLDKYIGEDSDTLKKLRNPYITLSGGRVSNFVEVNPETGTENLGLKKDERFINKNNCRLPSAYDEVAITDIKADMFIRYGYKTSDGKNLQISSPDDLIGLEIDGFHITGVYSTEQDADYFRQYDINNFGMTQSMIIEYNRNNVEGCNTEKDYKLNQSLYSSSSSIISCGFVLSGYSDYKYGDSETKKIMFRLSGDMGKDTELLEILETKNLEYFSLYSAVSNFIGNAEFFYVFVNAELIISAVFAVFAILLMMNYFSISIDYRHRELGILRALGAGKKELVLICLSESLTLSFIIFALSIIGIIVACIIINSLYMVSLYFFGIVPLAMLFTICFSSSALSTLIPVLNLVKKKPIDILNNK